MLVDIVVERSSPLRIVVKQRYEGVGCHNEVEGAHILWVLEGYLVQDWETVEREKDENLTYTNISVAKSIVEM